ncbi:MAG TPA: ATP-binding protein [Candidatus Moranbacteria bacterium]|jgi:C4-dicarboxylate-specific signal transduction histidine kinase|nr:ATP-binding protein [Candidatus Moranbacteria bacterium]
MSKEEGKYSFLIMVTRFLYGKLLLPKSNGEDLKRQEFIFNVIVSGSSVLFCVFSLFSLYHSLVRHNDRAISPLVPLVLFCFFVFLHYLSRKGFFVIASYIFVYAYLITASYAVYVWGVDLPMALLTFALLIVISGILISTRFAFEINFIILLVTLILGYLQLNHIISPKVYWKTELFQMNDPIGHSIIFSIIAVVSWLSNREIERSLKRARKSEAELKEERDTLEVRVQERTKELEKSQMEKINQTARFIEFGKISSGLFHDLINHITFLFFDIEKANDAGEKEHTQTKEYLKQANETKDLLVEYIEAVKKQFQNQKVDSLFSMKKEILNITKLLNYKLTTEKVKINLKGDFDIITYGNDVRFNHVIINIILNALDAYEISDEGEKEIDVKLDRLGKKAIISIEDWAGGISEDIQEKIFEPFFTTKGPQKGTGIGLTTVKNIVENDFGGTIKVESVWGQGSKFIIEIPIRDES